MNHCSKKLYQYNNFNNWGELLMKSQLNTKLKAIVYTALSIAMVTLMTMVIRIPSVRGGYVNFGDIMIFITAVFLGKKAGFLAGGIGSALADIISSYMVYAPATFVIKGLEGLICGLLIERFSKDRFNSRSIISSVIISGLWMVFGYFMFEYAVGGWFFANEDFGIIAALSNLPGNLIQGLVSAAAAMPFILAIKKTGISFDNI